MKAPYGNIVVLKADATNVECWNFADRSVHTLPKGTRLQLEHVSESDSTVCMLVDEAGNHPGIMLHTTNGNEQRGYRFVLKNADLNRLADAGLPATVFDCVSAMMAYEQGDLNDADTRTLFLHLKEEGLLSQLQGHYGRTARAMGII